MTYTTSQELTDTAAKPMPTTVEKLKTLQKESAQRYQRVSKILKSAFTETVSEIKAGKSVISPLAKEVTAETVASVKAKGQQAQTTVNKAWNQNAETEDVTERIVRFARTLSLTTATAAKENLLPQLKLQTTRLDSLLANRYGTQYQDLKDRFNVARLWRTASTPDTSTQRGAKTAENGSIVVEVDSETID
ncbi:MAG: hypothetical protein HLUCCA11_10860 [Phormidesmis priestleyi Ana]|uniref:Uncharacterized protein n=1 Tax=Phormidesmis priestleyi Ana TaxID=1666911 RepID=A0A0P8DG70_9CYAN|nr:MAG: hypothetical protein HLUCCA11_10860 [Phormidesmis priestleyi Ana]